MDPGWYGTNVKYPLADTIAHTIRSAETTTGGKTVYRSLNTGDHVYNVTALYKSDTNEENESSFSNDATLYVNGIAEITASGQQGDQPRYNLAGQRVSKDYRGVVVEQGRKIIIK